jgi:hypothetical protein
MHTRKVEIRKLGINIQLDPEKKIKVYRITGCLQLVVKDTCLFVDSKKSGLFYTMTKYVERICEDENCH